MGPYIHIWEAVLIWEAPEIDWGSIRVTCTTVQCESELNVHYRTRLLCRVPETLGKGRKTLGKEVAECSTRRSAHGLSSKNRQNLTLHNSSYLMTTKKITSKTPTRTSLWLDISKNPSEFYETSSEMPRFVNYIHDNFSKAISNFYHRLPVWSHDVMTNFKNFWLLLNFIN